MQMTVRVSVLIDTYNHEKYIEAAINSVLAQEGLSDVTHEILVIDDGSTDKTGEIVRSFGDSIKYFYKPNGGQASAFNFGIPLCRGEIICFLDGDDWWHPRKLTTVLNAFQENEKICGVGHSIIETDEVGGTQYEVGPRNLTRIDFALQDSIALFIRFASCLGTSRLAMRRSAALSLLDIPTQLVFEADEYLFTLLPTLGEVIILPDALTYYRIHGENLYQDSRSAIQSYKSDPRLLKRAAIYQCLSEELSRELQDRGYGKSFVELLLGPVHVQASRLSLMTRGGTPLENFRSERYAAKVSKRKGGPVSRVVFLGSLTLALVLPPEWYFRVRQSYSNFLRRN
jgi:glycosyltransferase involved in cell wall biosynthesis